MRVLLGYCLFVCLALSVRAQARSVAITIDDLPCADCAPAAADGASAPGVLESTNQRLVAALTRAHIPVTGFVVTQAADQAGISGQHALQLWLNAGFDLGSHSYSHPNFANITTEQMEAEIARADATLRPLVAASGRKLHYFRFPYNDTGDTQAKHDAVAAFLKEHGYRIATCTIDTSDYTFAAAYARALGADDEVTAARIRREYLAYSATEIDFYAALNRRVLSYEPPEVMLLHDSLLNADTIDDVLALFHARGYSFVSLAKAQHNRAYAIPDTYIAGHGPMWGYRWAQERNLGHLGMQETEPPDWITGYANGDPAPGNAQSKAGAP